MNARCVVRLPLVTRFTVVPSALAVLGPLAPTYYLPEATFPDQQPWPGEWLIKVEDLFHLARLRRKSWQPELLLPGQSEDCSVAHGSLQASRGKLCDDALQE